MFVVFGAGKYVDHASELASFRAYGLPAPGRDDAPPRGCAPGVAEFGGTWLIVSPRGLAVR